jgi:hypothetical protein
MKTKRTKKVGGLVSQWSRKPKALMALLEQDAQIQAERLAMLEKAIMTPIIPMISAQPVLVPAYDEPVDVWMPEEAQPEKTVIETVKPFEVSAENPRSNPEYTPATGAMRGRNDYQYIAAQNRIRRRLIQ